MPADEPVRLRLHRRLTELLDPDLADAMMESMPPMRWDHLATKDDIDRLDARGDRLEIAIQAQGERLETMIHDQGERLETAIRNQGQRLETIVHDQSERLLGVIDGQGQRLETIVHDQSERLSGVIDGQGHRQAGEMALLEGRLSVRYVETTRMIVFAMMTLFVGVVAVMVTTLS